MESAEQSLSPLPGTDELYHVQGGNEQLAQRMAAELPSGSVAYRSTVDGHHRRSRRPVYVPFRERPIGRRRPPGPGAAIPHASRGRDRRADLGGAPTREAVRDQLHADRHQREAPGPGQQPTLVAGDQCRWAADPGERRGVLRSRRVPGRLGRIGRVTQPARGARQLHRGHEGHAAARARAPSGSPRTRTWPRSSRPSSRSSRAPRLPTTAAR